MSDSSSKPNVLLIMTDQQRWDYMGCAGADFLDTPNLDRLARRGVHFPNCFTNSPLCAPARIGLATGLHPGITGADENDRFLPPDRTTYYQRLRDVGYRVACSGKLDLAKSDSDNGPDGRRPRLFQWGFTDPMESEGKGHSLGKPYPRGSYGAMLKEKGLYQKYYEERHSDSSMWYSPSELPAETFLDVYQGQRAVEWLRDFPRAYPWHLFVSFSGPHVPHDPPREYFDRYADRPMPDPIPAPEDERSDYFQHNQGTGPSDPAAIQQARRAYCAYIELIDEQVGQLMDVLEERGELEDTYIMFTSDHGEMLGDLEMWMKKQPFEPSIRVPLIAAGPEIPEGRTCDALIELIDINPTICELAGLSSLPHMHALSFTDCLSDPSQPHRTNIVSTLRQWRCIRTDRYKLVRYYNDAEEMYDLKEDPAETCNCLSQMQRDNPAVVDELRERLEERLSPSPYAHHRT
ncbi:MAG: sulfatase [Candidatus Brocadiia bacterium]